MSAAPPAVVRLTPAGIGGVAVLAVHPGAAQAELARLLGRTLPGAGSVAYGMLERSAVEVESSPIDEVLVVGRRHGIVEVHLHGSPAVVEEVVEALGGTARAECARATIEERAAIAAPLAPTDLGARVLLDQSRGALRAELEVALEAAPVERARSLAALVARGRRLIRLLTPATVVLVGPVNAGKSTLFNVLAGEEVAAVTDVPGTTRDALGVPARLGPWPVVLVDTAGERSLEPAIAAGDRAAEVERAGQDLALAAAERADIVLALSPVGPDPVGGGPPPERSAAPGVHHLGTQAALTLGPDPGRWGAGALSALESPAHARTLVADLVAAQLDPGPRGEALWSPGRAVPFEVDLIAALEEVVRDREADRSALASLVDAL